MPRLRKLALIRHTEVVSSLCMHADLEKLLSLGKIPQTLADKLDRISPGRYCHHKTWGTGKIASWHLPTKKLTIDFEARQEHEMALDLAFKSLMLLEDNHFLVQRYEKLGKLKALGKEDPVNLIRITLEGHGNSLKPEDVEKSLKGTIIGEKDWKNWWDKVRVELHSRVEFSMPTRKGELIRLRQDKLSFMQAVLEDYLAHNKDIKARIRVLDPVKNDKLLAEREITTQVLVVLDRDIRTGSSPIFQQILEIAVIRDEFADVIKYDTAGFLPLSDLLQNYAASIPDVVGAIPSTRQHRIYEALPKAFGNEDWITIGLEIFDRGGARAIGEIAKFIKEQGKEQDLLDHLALGITNQTLSPDALIWTCRNRKTDAEKVFCLNVGTAILNLIDYDHTEGGPSKVLRLKNLIMDDKALVKDFIIGSALGEVRQFAKMIFNAASFPEMDRKALLARMMEIRPEVQEIILNDTSTDSDKNNEPLFVSWASIDKRKAEYEDLVNVKIPQNKHNKSLFRAEGDLRENAGYQDAKEVERVLNRRRAELERDLAMARGTDFKASNTDAATMGTRVILQSDNGQQAYTIMGAWDSDPETHTISYLSHIGKQIVGHKVGDTIKFIPINEERKKIFTIVAIEAVNP
ncbi:MAG: GreA/GreB family elongation factor [Akkermansia sp.]